MKKKHLVLVLMVALLFVAAGAVSAGAWDNAIQMQVDTSLDVHCQGGYILTDVSNNSLNSIAHIACVSYYPPR